MRKIVVFNLVSLGRYFAGADKDKHKLKLVNTRTFGNGNVLLSYVV